MTSGPQDTAPLPPRNAANQERQRELYGAPLGDRVRRLTTALGITQARLARTLGVSPAMLSQLVSARRVKIGDPAVLARLLLIDQRCADTPAHRVDELLREAECAHWQWSGAAVDASRVRAGTVRVEPRPPPARLPGSAADALRRIAPPARLAAAAATLGPGFPELAEVLRQAAGRGGR